MIGCSKKIEKLIGENAFEQKSKKPGTGSSKAGPVKPRINPNLKQGFESKNMSLERTKYCCVLTPRFGDDNMLP